MPAKTRVFSFLLLCLFGAASCSKKGVLTLNESVLSKPSGGSPVWYTGDNILSKGTGSLTIYSTPALLRQYGNGVVSGPIYALRFSPTTLLEITRFNPGDSVLDLTKAPSISVNAPYYFVTAKEHRNMGLWQPDGYRIYMINRFLAIKNDGGYVVNFVQLQ